MLLSTLSITSSPTSFFASRNTTTEVDTPSASCFSIKDPIPPHRTEVAHKSPHDAPVQRKKRHTLAGQPRHKPQKEQHQPLTGTYVEQANVKGQLSEASISATSILLQLPNHKRNSLWLTRKTRSLGTFTTKNANSPPPVPERPNDAPMSLVSLAVGSNISSTSCNNKPRPRPSHQQHTLHPCSSRPLSAATSLSIYSQSSCSHVLQVPSSKDTDFNPNKVGDDHGCPLGSASAEVMLDSSSSKTTTPPPPPPSMGCSDHCQSVKEEYPSKSNSLTPTLTSFILQHLSTPSPNDGRVKQRYDKEEVSAPLCLDYDYTAVVDHLVHCSDAANSLGLGLKPAPDSTQLSRIRHHQFRATHRPRSSHSSHSTSSRRPSSPRHGRIRTPTKTHSISISERLSTSSKREFLLEYRAHSPASSALCHRSSTSRSSLSSAGATRRRRRPTTPRRSSQKVGAPPWAQLAPAAVEVSIPSPAQTLVDTVHGQGAVAAAAKRIRKKKRLGTEPVKLKAALTTQPEPPNGAGIWFGRLRGRGGGNQKPPTQTQRRKSVFFHVAHFFARG